MQKNDISMVSKVLCSSYRWLGEKEELPSDLIDFLVKQRGSIETIIRESVTETYLVACDGSLITGIVAVNKNEITKLYIDPKHHRQGIGRLLFSSAEKIITTNGYSNIILGAFGNSPVAFYKSMEMSITGRKVSKPGNSSEVIITLMEKTIVS